MITRRKLFHSATAALPLGMLGAPGAAHANLSGAHADIVVTRGNLLTMDTAMPKAEAMAITGHHIQAVGSNDDVANLIGPNTNVIDAAGMTVAPGFIDGHSHL